MAYKPLPTNWDTFNDSQRNEAAISAGYTGLNDYNDQRNRGLANPQGNTTPGASTASLTQSTIDLPKLYESLYQSSGIRGIETQLSDKERAFAEQTSKIKDNPYLSEATMTGRLSKLSDKFNADATNVRSDIATKKADIETQLNLQTKQFDINSQQAQTAFNQFNSLLSSGSLDNATGEDIANITRSTGISSSMIQSAIDTSKASKVKPVNTQVIQVDDGSNVSAVIINQDTGEVINSQVIGKSEPSKATGGGSTFTPTQERAITSKARKAITSVDTNEDKRLSIAEYKKAVAKLMADAGIDFNSADDYAASAFTDLGFVKWGKGW